MKIVRGSSFKLRLVNELVSEVCFSNSLECLVVNWSVAENPTHNLGLWIDAEVGQ